MIATKKKCHRQLVLFNFLEDVTSHLGGLFISNWRGVGWLSNSVCSYTVMDTCVLFPIFIGPNVTNYDRTWQYNMADCVEEDPLPP